MNKFLGMVLLIAVFLVTGFSGQSQASNNPMQGVAVVAVKSMQVGNVSGDYKLNLIVQMRNSGDNDMKLKENIFKISLGTNGNQPSYLGVATPKPFLLKKAVSSQARNTDVFLEVSLGKDHHRVLKKLLHVMNVVGDPANKVAVAIEAQTKAWVEIDKGWISNGQVEMELAYNPKVQREVLME